MEADWQRPQPVPPWPDAIVRTVAAQVVSTPGEVTLLGGGLANACWRVDGDGGPVVVRAWLRDPAAAATECALLAEVAERVPVPRVLHTDAVDGVPVAVLSWVDGAPLARVWPRLTGDEVRAVFADAGRVLRAVQDQGYPTPGLLGRVGPHVDVVEPFASVGEVWRAYLTRVLFDQGGGDALGDDRLARVWGAVASFGAVVDEEREVVLCHADYKPENLRVVQGGAGWRVSGVLDWEFSWASSPWFDVGQLLRWEHRLPPGVAEAVVRGWQRHPAEVPDDWRLRARLLDLMNLCGFLPRLSGPAMTADVIELIDRSLAALSSEA